MLTDLEARILDFVTRHITQYGTAPKITEIGIAVDIRSKGTVHRYLQSLIRKGYLQSIKGQQRGLRLPGGMPESDSFSLPLVGRIAAGRPIEAVSGLDSINLNQLFVRPGRFLIKVSGNSMRDAGILDGDFVVVEKKEMAETGDIVVALIDQTEVTLKHLGRRKDDRIELRPANPEFPTQIYDAERVLIQGVVVGNLRIY